MPYQRDKQKDNTNSKRYYRKNRLKFCCDACNVYFANQNHFNRHNITHKHKLKTDTAYAQAYKQRKREKQREAMRKYNKKKNNYTYKLIQTKNYVSVIKQPTN